MLKKAQLLTGLLALFISQLSFAQSVNVLTWWGYLNHPEISQIVKQQCNVDLSYDEYYTNGEFLRRFSKNKSGYDIVIFSNTIYGSVKGAGLPEVTSPLRDMAQQYNPIIKKHYMASNLPENVGYFMHSLSGFLWNPKNITLSGQDSIQSIFDKADGKIVVLIDDPVELWNLLNRGLDPGKFAWADSYSKAVPLTLANYKKLVNNAKVYIVNDLNKFYDDPNFAFAFMWTGDAIVDLKATGQDFKFLIHPKLSYISTDLIVNLNDNSDTQCVVKALDSQKVLDIIQEKDFYFSPYGDYTVVKDPTYHMIYSQMYDQLNTLSWLVPLSANDYNHLITEWYKIQIYSLGE